MSDTAVLEREATTTPVLRDKELELYRSLLETPKEYKNGFTWTVVAGAIFCGLLMMPGSIYLSLLTGGAINASWVTVIIFSEISRRALKSLNTQELVVLLYVAGAMSLGGPIAQLIFRQYFVQSDAVRDIGLLGRFPSWWAPQPGSDALLGRALLHHDWLVPILIMIFVAVIGRVSSYTLGYFFFRLTSDVEKLPFPMAPVAAQGAMALAESSEKKTTSRWKVFSVGTVIGMIFAFIQIGVPLISGALLAKPIQIIPLPFYDATTLTEGFLPATPMGIVMDLGLVILGMIVPFWAVVGSGIGILLTGFLNPLLHHTGVLTRWHEGMDTIATTYNNQVDFWMCFGLGVAGGVAVISIFRTLVDVGRVLREAKARQQEYGSDTARREQLWSVPEGRGDFSPWAALAIYGVCAATITAFCHTLVPGFPIFFLLFFTFLYTPLISYVNAKIHGICGQSVDIPFIREGAFILSGYKGVDIWLAPIPIDNHGLQSQHFRVTELTGTNFWSYVKADLLVVPLSFVLSLVFWAFIWHASAIPSDNFPWAQKMWDLQAKQTLLTWSATLPAGGGQSLFSQAMHPHVPGGGWTVGLGAGALTIVAFSILSVFGVPIMAIYGFIQAVGGMPHSFIPQIIGALIAKFYLRKRFGEKNFLQMATVLFAGYTTGVGLSTLLGVAIYLITKAISAAPF